MDLRERIKAARNNLGITQDELAKYSGISIQNIKKLESKENTNPTNNTLQKLAIALKEIMPKYWRKKDLGKFSCSAVSASLYAPLPALALISS